MKQYGYLQTIVLSFYSRDLYRDVAKNWGATVVIYLFLLLAICWGILMFRLQPTINLMTTQFANELTPQLPETIHVKNGIVTTPENQPYLIKTPESKEIVAVIDTSGKYKDLREAHAQFLVTKDTVMYMDDGVARTQKIGHDLNLDIKPIKIKEYSIRFMGWSWMLLFPFFLLASFIYRLVQSLFYAFIGKLFAALADISISYSEVLTLTIVAMTPAIVISTIVEWFALWASHSHLMFYFMLSIVYLIFAIGAVKKG